MDRYIKYHRKPYAKYLNVSQFNEKYDTNIAVDTAFDQTFLKKYNKLRRMGQDEYIMGDLNVIIKQSESLEDVLDKHSEIEDIVLERAKTKNQGEIDLKNIIHFNNQSNIRDRLVKGTKKNIQKLKAYVEGEDSVIRLSYRKTNKEVNISELKPDIQSLKAFLHDIKNIREVKCL
mgnify:CR=1 FL=1